MADDNNLVDSPSTPLPLSGFVNGDTIQVHGDTGSLQFSLQFNIRQQQTRSPDNHFHFPDLTTPGNKTPLDSRAASSYLTPVTTPGIESQYVNMDGQCPGSAWNPGNQNGSDEKADVIMTRLRTGVLSRISYLPPQRSGALQGGARPWKRLKVKQGNGETGDSLETILRQRSRHPVRPCSSYSLFVMASWGRVGGSSFGAKSKRLGEIWYKLSHDEKKVYADLALKDSARYKRQCMLLKDYVKDE